MIALEPTQPYLRTFPDIFRVLGILFNDGQNACGDDAMGATEVMIDL